MLRRSIFTAFLCPSCQNFQQQDAPPSKLKASGLSLLCMHDASAFPVAHAAPAPRAGHVKAVAACGLTTALTWPIHDILDPVNTVMLFLLTVVLVATRWGRGPAVLASFLSVGLFDFFYVPPRWSFAVSDIQYLLTFAVMLTVALIIGHLTIGLRQRADEASASAERSQALYTLASHLSGAMSIENVRQHGADFAATQLHAELSIWICAPDNSLVPATPDDAALPRQAGPDLLRVMHMVHHDCKGVASHQISDSGKLIIALPLTGSTRSRGVLLLSPLRENDPTLDHQRPLLDAVTSLVATAIERLHFVEVAHLSQLEANGERLRNSILAALSHDIRTPLTALYGLADTLTLIQPPLPDRAQEMSNAIRDQAMRLNRMVSNLLDMARLQSEKDAGRLPLRLEWQPIEEVIGASIQMLGTGLQGHAVQVHLPSDLPLVHIDAVLMERVFGNLIENAAKYSPNGSIIQISAEVSGTHLDVRVSNEGSGFPPDKLQDVFNLFERGMPESTVPGVGLGLAICRAIVEAHGGHIEASNPPAGGSLVRFGLPLGSPPTFEPEWDGEPQT